MMCVMSGTPMPYVAQGISLVPRPPTKKEGLVHTARVFVRMREK